MEASIASEAVVTGTFNRAQRKAEREKEQADRAAAREQGHTERLERRYPTTDADRQQDPAAATGAVLGAAAADAIDNATDRDAAVITADGRDNAHAATEEIQTDAAAQTEPLPLASPARSRRRD